MPSIQDVADQINTKLDTITTNTGNTATNTANTTTELTHANGHLVTIDSDLQIGFANLSQGIFSLAELQKTSIALLERNRDQNDTIICLLENANELLCGITRKLTLQLNISSGILNSNRKIEGIIERVHATEAADFDRLLALHAEIEKCCPPPEPKPEPCPEPCPNPDYRPYEPKGQDWKPLPTPKQPQ